MIIIALLFEYPHVNFSILQNMGIKRILMHFISEKIFFPVPSKKRKKNQSFTNSCSNLALNMTDFLSYFSGRDFWRFQ